MEGEAGGVVCGRGGEGGGGGGGVGVCEGEGGGVGDLFGGGEGGDEDGLDWEGFSSAYDHISGYTGERCTYAPV